MTAIVGACGLAPGGFATATEAADAVVWALREVANMRDIDSTVAEASVPGHGTWTGLVLYRGAPPTDQEAKRAIREAILDGEEPPLRVVPAWATVVKGDEDSYRDIALVETEARNQVGTTLGDGERVVGVKEGFCIVDREGMCPDAAEDIYWTRDAASADMERLEEGL